MAKKKKKSTAGGPPAKISDKGYLTSGRARNLPIYKCLVNTGWEEMGMAQVYVLRQHANDNVTVGIFLVDTFCAGMKDSFYIFNDSKLEIEERFDSHPLPLEEISYELAHNIIYGAIAFAEDYGIEPDPSFKLTQYILEEDTDEVELIELDFGKNGKPVLILNPDSGPRVEYFIRQLEKHAGPGNYEVIDEFEDASDEDDFDEDEYDYYDHPEEWDDEEWEEFIDDTKPEELIKYPAVGLFMFDKLESEPHHAKSMPEAKFVEFDISFDPLPNQYSAEELEELSRVQKIIKDTEATDEELKALETALLANIEKWTGNIDFYVYLISTYRILEDDDEADKVVVAMYKKFPDVIKARALYAQYLLDEERTDEVPAVFDNQLNFSSLFPDRKTFYISEVLDYNYVMAEYFLDKENLTAANNYIEMIEQLDLPPEADVMLDPIVFFAVKGAIIKKMEAILEEAKQDEVKKLQLIAKLVK